MALQTGDKNFQDKNVKSLSDTGSRKGGGRFVAGDGKLPTTSIGPTKSNAHDGATFGSSNKNAGMNVNTNTGSGVTKSMRK